MEKKLCCIRVTAYSNLNTRIQLTLSEETEDLRHLISMALLKLDKFNTGSEIYYIEHIDSMSYFQDQSK